MESIKEKLIHLLGGKTKQDVMAENIPALNFERREPHTVRFTASVIRDSMIFEALKADGRDVDKMTMIAVAQDIGQRALECGGDLEVIEHPRMGNTEYKWSVTVVESGWNE